MRTKPHIANLNPPQYIDYPCREANLPRMIRHFALGAKYAAE
jgi:hypothetical protein